jgi:hypothetical protein
MNVVCGVNGESWGRDTPLYVCHHCGMPVCAKDGVTIAADEAFDASDAPMTRAAMHCPGCANEYHRGARRYTGWVDPRAAQSTARAAPAPAVVGQNRARALGSP